MAGLEERRWRNEVHHKTHKVQVSGRAKEVNVMAHGPVIDKELCIGCDKCIEACPMDVFSPAEKSGDPP